MSNGSVHSIAEALTSTYNSRWKPYPAYKDSGVEWLGEVPEHWEAKRMKRICSLLKDGTHQPPSRKISGFPLLSVRNIVNGKFINLPDDSLISEEDFNILQRSFVIKKKDILLAIVGATIGKVATVEEMPPFTIQRSLAVLRSRENIAYYKYLSFFLQSSNFQRLLWMNVGFSAQPGIYLGSLSNFNILLPNLEEQHAIASFLDRETARIDTLIFKKERLITLFQEKRAALISRAVTRGLDPDVPMKDSGVEWLGEVPEHWEETVTSALFMENKKKNKNTQETNLLSLSYGNIIRKDINSNEGLLPETFGTYQIVDSGYIVLRLTDLQNDKRSLRTGHVNEKGIITSAYVVLVKKSNAVESTKYFYSLLHTYDIMKVFYGMGAGVRQSLNFNELKKLSLLLPPPMEQTAIVSFLDRETARIDTLISKIREGIEKLREYRTALISAAVTGKIDVREGVD